MKLLNSPKKRSLVASWIAGGLSISLLMLAMACGQSSQDTQSTITPEGNPAVEVKIPVEIKMMNAHMNKTAETTEQSPAPSRNVHAFYYPWYANPQVDGEWDHWNHPISVGEGEPPREFSGGDDIGSNFYPSLGSYSVNDPATLRQHMAWLTRAGVGVISLSWWGPERYSKAVPKIMDAAAEAGLKVCFHLEPFHNGDIQVVRDNIEYIFLTWGDHPAFYRTEGGQPMFYVYDSYNIQAADWARVLAKDGDLTVRGTALDGIYLGLWVKQHEEDFMLDGHFDGFYTYFASNGFTYGSTLDNWPDMAAWAKAHGLLFVPSVGPGYDDTRIKPWNTLNYRNREGGAYYDKEFQAAIDVQPEYISITSFNEWGEGTIIEPAVPKAIPTFTYSDYSPNEPEYYLDATKKWIEIFETLSNSE